MFSKNQSGSSLNRQLFETYMALDNWHQFRLRLFIEGIFVGIAGGLSISLFRFLLNESEDLRIYLYYTCLIPPLRRDDLLPLLSYALLLLAIGGALYAMCRYAPMAGGSGIPQVKGVILGLMKMKWLRILWVKILAGAIGIGAGLSLGREGPSIQIGAVAGQGLSRMLGRTRMEERYLITSGASAGLAAAFNAPLAGMMFALEELHRNFSGAVLLPTMTSAITATIVTRCFFGNGTSFHFVDLVPLPAQYLWYVALIALICGLAGIIFNYGLLHIGASTIRRSLGRRHPRSFLPSSVPVCSDSSSRRSWAAATILSTSSPSRATRSPFCCFFWQPNISSPSSATAAARPADSSCPCSSSAP